VIKLIPAALCLLCGSGAWAKDLVKDDGEWVYRCTAQAKVGEATGATTIYLNARGKEQFISTDLSWFMEPRVGPKLQISSSWFDGVPADSFPKVSLRLFAYELPRGGGGGPLRFEIRTDPAKPASDQRLIGYAKKSSGQFSLEISAAAVTDLIKLGSPSWLVVVDKKGHEVFRAQVPIPDWPNMLRLAKQSSADAIAMTRSFATSCEPQGGKEIIVT